MKAPQTPNPSAEFIEAIDALSREKRIDKESLFAAIEQALVAAYKRDHEGITDNVVVEANEALHESYLMDDADVCVVAFGIAARVAKNAVVAARGEGIKAGMIRPITLWPFPKAPLRKAADQVKRFVCVELNMGQMREDVQLAVACKKPVDLCFRVGGMIPSPDEVLDAIRKANEGGND